MDNKSLQAVIAAALAALTYYLGIIAIPLVVLIFVMLLDYITGMLAAWYNAELESRKGAKGIVKKVGYMALVAVAMGIDWLIYCGLQQLGINLGYSVFFAVLVAIWLIINEMLSVLENLNRIGVPIPKFLVKIINRLKVTVEKESGDK